MKFRFVQSTRQVLWRSFVTRFVDPLRSKDLSLFVRSDDMVTTSQVLYGDYEPHMLAFFNWASEAGHSDFLIDIGGNIGLSCCPVGGRFNKLFVFEPNPLAFKILEVNVALQTDEARYTLFNLGIGSSDARLDLMIPKHNWGGAFIVSDDNTYSEELLAKKDRFDAIDPENYVRTEVEVREGSAVFSGLFEAMLSEKSSLRGVVKIDVEGFEQTVIEELAKSLPRGVSVLIVFENWDDAFDLDRVQTAFGDRASAYQLKKRSIVSPRMPLIIKIALFPIAVLLGRGSNVYSLEEIGKPGKDESIVGDLVLEVKS